MLLIREQQRNNKKKCKSLGVEIYSTLFLYIYLFILVNTLHTQLAITWLIDYVHGVRAIVDAHLTRQLCHLI